MGENLTVEYDWADSEECQRQEVCLIKDLNMWKKACGLIFSRIYSCLKQGFNVIICSSYEQNSQRATHPPIWQAVLSVNHPPPPAISSGLPFVAGVKCIAASVGWLSRWLGRGNCLRLHRLRMRLPAGWPQPGRREEWSSLGIVSWRGRVQK